MEFNPIQVNTYILYDEAGNAAIIDPGCYGKQEEDELGSFIATEKLVPLALINTHAHTDHILGNHFVIERYKLSFQIHKDCDYFLERSTVWADMLGFSLKSFDKPTLYLDEGSIIKIGSSELKVVNTPGHADGSICLINYDQKFVITGDVLFAGSIGRSDLPTGDFDVLKKNILEKLYTLDDDFTVFPGHGPPTTIGHEKLHNPFMNLAD